MPADTDRPIAYLVPAHPSLSETFITTEIAALERAGHRIDLYCLRTNRDAAARLNEGARRAVPVYEAAGGSLTGAILSQLATRPGGAVRAAGRLLADFSATLTHPRSAAALGWQFLAAFRLARHLRETQARHLHAHFAHTPAQVAMYAAPMAGIPFSLTAHANDIYERGLLLRRKAARARRLVTVSEHNRRYLEGIGITPARLDVVRCMVTFPPPGRRRGGGAPPRIGSIGRLVAKKGMAVLIEAVRRLVATGRDIRLEIAGDGPERAALEAQVAEARLAGHVAFLGAMAHADVPGWMSSLDVFALACRRDESGDVDGIPVVLMEAMFQGVPTVSTRLSGIPELIEDDSSGLLAEPDDATSLADALERLLSDPGLAARLAEGGRTRVLNEFSEAVNVARLERIFSHEPTSGARA